jgi:hypothetical protein
LGEITGRRLTFEPYGIALPKKVGRAHGVNPVWYVDITPGHDWLMNPVNRLIDDAIRGNTFAGSPIERIAPFIEQMGSQVDADLEIFRRKEFWWEREWRFCGAPLHLPNRVIVLCPEDEIPHFETLIRGLEWMSPICLDPRWGLEQIIGRLAGFSRDAMDIL